MGNDVTHMGDEVSITLIPGDTENIDASATDSATSIEGEDNEE